MEIAQLQQIIAKFCQLRDWDQFHNPKDLAIGLSTEANELLEIFRFVKEADLLDTLEHKREAIEDELMDALFFILRFTQLYHIDIEHAFIRKMEKNNLRYPVEVVKGKNKKYNEY
ncbi:MAG: nucleotide pyrophosphohydrolase [Erysipelothrix sp.]|nr:nucleotide pyrophosphohydrolase [Erysipelothrix sp.]